MKQQQQLMGIMVTPSGQWIPMFDISLAKLQEAVGGYIDVVAERDYSIFVNDDGIGQQLEINVGLMRLFDGLMLAGTAVITGGVDHEGNTLPITDEMTLHVMKHIPIGDGQIRTVIDNAHTYDLIKRFVLTQ